MLILGDGETVEHRHSRSLAKVKIGTAAQVLGLQDED